MNKVIKSFLMLALMFATATLVSAAHWTDASPCDEIFFSTFFDVPQTIFISQQLNLRGNLIIHGKGAHLLTIRNIAPPQSNSRIFLVQVNITARIEGLTLSGGRVTNGANGGAILNEGTHAHPNTSDWQDCIRNCQGWQQ